MIDVDALERRVADLPGEAVALTRDVLAEIIAELRRGQTARRALADTERR